MLSHQDRISILITFVVGLLAGSYLYLTGFATTFEPPEVSTDDIYTQFVITAESYGDCEETDDCISLQLLENGMYRALWAGEVKEARIPMSLRSELRENLTGAALKAESGLGSGDCRYDTNNYRFKITRDNENYYLDTCSGLIDYEALPWLSLAKLWNYFATLEW